MSVVDIKTNQLTPQKLLEKELAYIEDTQDLIIIVIDKTGNIDMGHTSMNYATMIGYMEAMKQDLLDGMRKS